MAKQLSLSGCSGWGGKRRGAGRPNRSGLVSHGKREHVDFKKPLNLTLRLKQGLPNLRKPIALKTFKSCCARAKQFQLHVLHFSLQSNHIHLIVEAPSNQALAKGMRSLAGSFAKRMIASLRKGEGKNKKWKGSIFAGRYHLRTIKNPTQMKNTLKYVLLNSTKHMDAEIHLDDFCSGAVFTQWRQLLGEAYQKIIELQVKRLPEMDPETMGLSRPRSWLAREGWMRAS